MFPFPPKGESAAARSSSSSSMYTVLGEQPFKWRATCLSPITGWFAELNVSASIV
jgi:hypothetical protein